MRNILKTAKRNDTTSVTECQGRFWANIGCNLKAAQVLVGRAGICYSTYTADVAQWIEQRSSNLLVGKIKRRRSSGCGIWKRNFLTAFLTSPPLSVVVNTPLVYTLL